MKKVVVLVLVVAILVACAGQVELSEDPVIGNRVLLDLIAAGFEERREMREEHAKRLRRATRLVAGLNLTLLAIGGALAYRLIA